MSEALEIRRVADEAWKELQDRLNIDYRRPAVITSPQDFEERCSQPRNVAGHSIAMDPSLCNDPVAYRLLCTIRRDSAPEGSALKSFLGPINFWEVPKKMRKSLLKHEESHFVAHHSDSIYGLASSVVDASPQELLILTERSPEEYALMSEFSNSMYEGLAYMPLVEDEGPEALFNHLSEKSKMEGASEDIVRNMTEMIVRAHDAGVESTHLLNPMDAIEGFKESLSKWGDYGSGADCFETLYLRLKSQIKRTEIYVDSNE